MDLSQAANYFIDTLCDTWTLKDGWLLGRVYGKLSPATALQSFGAPARWRNLLVTSPLSYPVIRVGGSSGPVYVVGQATQDIDISPYGYTHPAYLADSLVKIYQVSTRAPSVGLAALADKATRTSVGGSRGFPCGIDRAGTSQAFDAVMSDMVLVMPNSVTLTAQHELDDADYTYQVKEAYKANGLQVVRATRKKKVTS